MSSISSFHDCMLVATSFVQTYYTFLAQKPQEMFNFYKKESTFTFGESYEKSIQIVGTEDIGKKIASLNIEGHMQVEILVCDAQDSQDGAVFVFVIGKMIFQKKQNPQHFVQTFLLARQQPSGYYILNEVFRYLAKDSLPSIIESNGHTPKEETKELLPTEKPKAVDAIPPKKEPEVVNTSTPTNSVPPESKINPKPTAPPPTKKETPPNQPKTSVAPPTKEQQVITETKPVEATTPASWASIAQENSPVNPPTKPLPMTKPPPKPINNNNQTKPSPKNDASKPSPKNDVSKPSPKSDAPKQSKSLYVKNLPFFVSEQTVREKFNQFGEIKTLSLHASKGFCFIEYVNQDIHKKVIQEVNGQNFMIDSRQLSVEERKPRGDKLKDKEPRKSPKNKAGPIKEKENKEKNSFYQNNKGTEKTNH